METIMLLKEKINKYRVELMGMGAIGVLMVHSTGVILLPNILNKIFVYGGIGVYIFIFLSGIGLYNSLKSRGGGV